MLFADEIGVDEEERDEEPYGDRGGDRGGDDEDEEDDGEPILFFLIPSETVHFPFFFAKLFGMLIL